ncbi:hypothetical protein UNDKW_3826 [Undibacterium sp. KW1]|uniref:Imm47 family immunity protein n=1 Tax=Undibacterium sp. KW1 TaxID=2058624 RepID=UPI001331F28C|nr:Imm47 family immunity protein [Undibacterium sp. KW1]BBB62099.1 hypothetical protein UNDKW_3826 [Undibacterium sp. KW1]
MNTFDILHPGPWFGEKPESLDAIKSLSSDNEEARFFEICRRLKCGDFTARSELERFILSCTNEVVKRLSIRLYCYIARHQDISFLGNLLASCTHEEVFSIVIYAPHTLSLQIVPYLFALLEEYESTSIEENILSSINKICPFEYYGGRVNIAELGERFAGFAKKMNLENYYYDGAEAFAGNLTKILIETAALARQGKMSFPLTDVPTLLSIWSGEKCPLFYGEQVADSDFESVIKFSKHIASMRWIRGKKYFYGYLIE